MDKVEILILRHLIYNEEYLRKVIPFIKSEYFEDSNQKIIFEEIFTFLQEYNKQPPQAVLLIKLA
jgi:replicative DNA helicase